MHTLARTRRFWVYDSLPWETNYQELPFSFEHVHIQEGKQGRNNNLPYYTFGMGDVKEERNGRMAFQNTPLAWEMSRRREATS